MAGYLFDTGIIIRHLRGRKPVVRLVRSLGRSERVAVATMTRLEVIAGMHDGERHTTQRLLSRFINLPLNAQIADRAGELVRRTPHNDRRLTVPDAVIAATALVHGLTLVTLNTNDFERIAGLSLYALDF